MIRTQINTALIASLLLAVMGSVSIAHKRRMSRIG
jgi:hypothetical protein